ncbi:hypothetical protein [Microbulbifer discodermiae]|uniref:hypothetical protein n=1 Tax=Microbulbifer sp. 2201CG32-9 TaxID=3232309 RepID=UPI00345BB208
MKKFSVIAIMILLSANAYPCSCRKVDLAEIYDDYSFVFEGTVTSIGTKWLWEKGEWIPNTVRKVGFQVSENFKGVRGSKSVIYTQLHSASCGHAFQKGKTYLVFAFKGTKEGEELGRHVKGAPIVTACGHTIDVEEANIHYKEYLDKTYKFIKPGRSS